MKPSKLSLLKVWILIPVLTTGLWSLTACQKQKRPSILIVAVDHLSFNSFSCSDDKQNSLSGLNILCKEGIRFTHAYTTSVQPAAAMTSLLTGAYPVQHRVHRSFDRLKANTPLIQEKASHLGYRTFFIGGSPSILKKTGLSIGFDIFDDFSFLDKKTYFLDFKFESEKFLSILPEDTIPFFAVIHNSELESLNEGETEISSFEKLDEKIFNFFKILKRKKIWDENYIIVLGLQGDSDATRLSETSFSNLNSENTMVTLFVKPPRSKGDEGVSWKVDSQVNIADLGLSLFNVIGNDTKATKTIPDNELEKDFSLIDFSGIWINRNQSLQNNSRKLLIESADPWTPASNLRFSVINKNLVFIENEKDKVFNTLTDGLESIDISNQQKQFLLDSELILTDLRMAYKIGTWKNYMSEWHPWVESNRDYWSKPNSRSKLFSTELDRLTSGPSRRPQPLSALMQKSLFQNKKIKELQKIRVLAPASDGKLTSEKSRETFYEKAKLQSLNLALENIWGLWMPSKNWIYPDFTVENQ